MTVTRDVAIIGGGILGLTLAHELINSDSRINIIIIRPMSADGSASLAAGAMLGCFSEVTAKTFSNPYGKKKFEISFKASHLWPEYLSALEEGVDRKVSPRILTSEGTFIMQNTNSGALDDENYDAILNALDDYNIPFQHIATKDIPGVNPIDNHRPLHTIYLENEKGVCPNALMQQLEHVLIASRRVEFLDGMVASLIFNEHEVSGLIDMKGNRIIANQVVLACGSFCQPLIDTLPIRYRIPRLFFGIGNALVAEKPDTQLTHIVRSPNRSFACGLHLLPRQGNQIYIGATNNVSLKPEYKPRLSLIHFLIQCAMEQVDRSLHDSGMVALIAGNRSVSIDTFPVIGPTSMAGLWILSGTYRDGFQQSPYIAKYIASRMLKMAPINSTLYQEFSFFPVERYPIQVLNRAQAVKESVAHYMSGAYEHHIKLPRVGWDDMIAGMMETKINNLFDSLGGDCILPPDLTLMFDGPDSEKTRNVVKNFYKNARSEFNTSASIAETLIPSFET